MVTFLTYFVFSGHREGVCVCVQFQQSYLCCGCSFRNDTCVAGAVSRTIILCCGCSIKKDICVAGAVSIILTVLVGAVSRMMSYLCCGCSFKNYICVVDAVLGNCVAGAVSTIISVLWVHFQVSCVCCRWQVWASHIYRVSWGGIVHVDVTYKRFPWALLWI